MFWRARWCFVCHCPGLRCPAVPHGEAVCRRWAWCMHGGMLDEMVLRGRRCFVCRCLGPRCPAVPHGAAVCRRWAWCMRARMLDEMVLRGRQCFVCRCLGPRYPAVPQRAAVDRRWAWCMHGGMLDAWLSVFCVPLLRTALPCCASRRGSVPALGLVHARCDAASHSVVWRYFVCMFPHG